MVTTDRGSIIRSSSVKASDTARSSDMTGGRDRTRAWPSRLKAMTPRPNKPSLTEGSLSQTR